MKKGIKRIFVIALVVFALVIFAGCSSDNNQANQNNTNNQQQTQQNDQQQTQQNTQNNSGEITEAAAKQAALKDAGFTEDQVKFTKCKLDYEDGVKVYEVEFVNGQKEYEYDINATNGSIVKKDIDSVND